MTEFITRTISVAVSLLVAVFVARNSFALLMRIHRAPRDAETRLIEPESVDPLVEQFRQLERQVAEREQRQRRATCPHANTRWVTDHLAGQTNLTCIDCGASPLYFRVAAPCAHARRITKTSTLWPRTLHREILCLDCGQRIIT